MAASHSSALLEVLSKAALDLLPVPVFVTAIPDGTILRCNDRAIELCGRAPRIQERLSDGLQGIDADGARLSSDTDPIAIALRSGSRIQDIEGVLETDGGRIVVSVSSEPVRALDDTVIAALIVCQVIPRQGPLAENRGHVVRSLDDEPRILAPPMDDDARRALAALRLEHQAKLALEAGKLGLWELNLETNALIASAQCKANHGLPADAELTFETGVLGAIDQDHRDRFRSAVLEAVETHEPFEIEVPHRWPDGTRHWLLVRGRAIDPTSMVGVTMDVTERRTIEQALRESEERFHTLADNIAQLAWMADETGWIFWYNRRWFEYTGTTLDEMRGWGWQKVHHPDHVQGVVERIRHSFATGEAWEDTFPLRSRDGTYRWFLSRALPIRNERGRIMRWFGTNTDITDQRNAELALLDADRRKDDFLALLGHELRNPLAPILTAASILQLHAEPDPKLQKARETILRQTLQLSKLVDDLLDVGRITAGKLRLDKERVELNAILVQAVETCSPLIERRRHTISVSATDRPVYLDVDAGRIVQVIGNLLNNAAKYMDEGGRIELTASERDGLAVVRVRDEGMGIPPEMLGRIFQRFVQIGTSDHRAEGGLGVGLSLVKYLVEMHGGSVEARSAGVGQGSEFIVRLPVAAASK